MKRYRMVYVAIMKEYWFVFIVTILLGGMLLVSNKSIAQDNIYQNTSFLFKYRVHSGILEARLNTTSLAGVDDLVRNHRKDLLAGRGHLSLVSYIRPSDLNNAQIINKTSIQASVVRAYIVVKHFIEHKYCTFSFDTAHYTNYRIGVEYIPGPIPNNANRQVYYTQKCESASIICSVKRYNPIPIIGSKNGEVYLDSRHSSLSITSSSLSSTRTAVDALKANNIEIDSKKMYSSKEDAFRKILEDNEKIKPKKCFVPLLGIKTILIYWAGINSDFDRKEITPNLELEYYFSKRWSLNIDGAYTYMDKKNDDQEIWGVSSVGIEPRVWLNGDRRFRGIYFGVYGSGGEFDVKLNSISTEGRTGMFYEGGVSLGCYLPISSRLGIEIGGRYGYRSIDRDIYIYTPPNHSYYQSSNKENDLKLTNIRFLLVYRLGKSLKIKSGR